MYWSEDQQTHMDMSYIHRINHCRPCHHHHLNYIINGVSVRTAAGRIIAANFTAAPADSPLQVRVAQQLSAASQWRKETRFCCFQDGRAHARVLFCNIFVLRAISTVPFPRFIIGLSNYLHDSHSGEESGCLRPVVSTSYTRNTLEGPHF